jgi:hypothetical protein
MLGHHGGAVEADLSRFHGIELADMWRGEITPRRIAVLVENLPQGAQTWVNFGGPMAVTPEAEATYVVEHELATMWWLHTGKKGDRPQFRDYPAYANPGMVPDPARDKAEQWRKREAARQRRMAEEQQ